MNQPPNEQTPGPTPDDLGALDPTVLAHMETLSAMLDRDEENARLNMSPDAIAQEYIDAINADVSIEVEREKTELDEVSIALSGITMATEKAEQERNAKPPKRTTRFLRAVGRTLRIGFDDDSSEPTSNS